MSTKTLRMAPEDEALLARIQRKTGMTASDALKEGLRALDKQLAEKPAKSAWEIYESLGVGKDEGDDDGPAAGRATESQKAVREILERKRKRWSA